MKKSQSIKRAQQDAKDTKLMMISAGVFLFILACAIVAVEIF